MSRLLDLFKGFEFQHPWVLLGLLALPAVAWWLGRKGPIPAVPFPSIKAIKDLGFAPRRTAGVPRLAVVLLTITLLTVALARPRIPKGEIPDPSKGIDIMLALDYSGSMTEKDYHLAGRRVTRAEALAHVVGKFIAKRPNDRIGIIGFARGPYLVSPLTLDHEWVMMALRQMVQSRGTAIGEAIVAAVHFLKKSSDRSKIIIIVSDGKNSAGRNPLETAPFAKKEGVRIYTVLIGPERLGGRELTGNEMLKVSKMTGGQLFQAGDTHTLQSVYDMIDLLEKKEFVQKRYQTFQELHPWLTAAALAVLLGQIATTQVLRRQIP